MNINQLLVSSILVVNVAARVIFNAPQANIKRKKSGVALTINILTVSNLAIIMTQKSNKEEKIIAYIATSNVDFMVIINSI